jgi:hypothetical protein
VYSTGTLVHRTHWWPVSTKNIQSGFMWLNVALKKTESIGL